MEYDSEEWVEIRIVLAITRLNYIYVLKYLVSGDSEVETNT
jgi:hypothetical protein